MNAGTFTHLVIRASAGSGKTHHLTNRYLGLLATGAEPESMLATTFTKKAAGEILDRVLARLARAAGDAALTQALGRDIGQTLDGPSAVTQILRKLLSNLHRVRISTLDSFYIALAGSFSLELALPAGWSICEETDDTELRRDALERLLDQQPDDIVKIFPLLSKGECKRSVQGELRDVIARHHEIFLGSSRTAWETLRVPAGVPAAQCDQAREQLEGSDFSDKRMGEALRKDIGRFLQQDWAGFIGNGLAGKVASGDPTYYKKPIPTEAASCYDMLVRHARWMLLSRLAEQTRATHDLLDRFDRELRALKQAGGLLRFGEVTQALVEGLQRKAFGADGLSFRLDGGVEHLLLDEFQDTALAQWRVLQPIAQRITKTSATGPQSECRSFFCVGDVKQAIYGWRGGMAAILDTLRIHLGALKETPLIESRRSAQPIIDAVNQFFGGLSQLELGEKAEDGLAVWRERFDSHTTFRKEIPGYVCLHAGPTRPDEQSLDDYRGRHYEYVAERVASLVRLAPGRSVGVLCRTNPAVARMIYELRKKNVDASEEGGNALTDSPAVELILSLFMLADHPGNSVVWFHLQNSPLKAHTERAGSAEGFSRQLRRSLLTDGYGNFTQTWAASIAPACDRRDLSRLQQVVEMAYAYQARCTLRAVDFVNYVRCKKVPAPSSAVVRVMTIHGAKGLQFDAVVLPELDCLVTGRPPSFVVGRDPRTLEVNFVCRYAEEAVQKLLEPKEIQAFELERQQRIEESLSLLYVAMTRAVHALYMVIPGPYKGKFAGKLAWCNLLTQILAPNATAAEKTNIWQTGDAKWFQSAGPVAADAAPEKPSVQPIKFRPDTTERRRGMDHVAPSSREGQAKVAVDRLFQPSEGTGTAAGTLYHAWFEAIEWLDNGPPAEETLRAVGLKLRSKLPMETWSELDNLLARFRGWLGNGALTAVLKQSAYANPQAAGFPRALQKIWRDGMRPLKAERERRFLVPDGDSFWNGSLDRVVWIAEGDRIVAADVLDFKTDAVLPGDAAGLQIRTEHYRPQLEAYRRVVAKLAGIAESHVAARLLFTGPGQVVDV